MNKRGVISLAQIFILILGVVAISYAIGSEVKIVAAETYVIIDGKKILYDSSNPLHTDIPTYSSKGADLIIKKSATANLPSATGTPTGYSSHGYAGQAGEFIAGAENVAPRGYEWVVNDAGKGSWVKTGGVGASSGLGYSITGILQGAMWGLLAYGVVQMIGPMIGLLGRENGFKSRI